MHLVWGYPGLGFRASALSSTGVAVAAQGLAKLRMVNASSVCFVLWTLER